MVASLIASKDPKVAKKIDKELYELLQDEGNRQVLIKSLTDSLDK